MYVFCVLNAHSLLADQGDVKWIDICSLITNFFFFLSPSGCRGEDILSILTQVNEDVARRVSPSGTKKQMPQPAYTLRKKIIFPIPMEPPPAEQHQGF